LSDEAVIPTFMGIGPMVMPGIAVMVSVAVDIGGRSGSENVSTIVFGDGPVVPSAGAVETSCGWARAALLATRATAAMARRKVLRETFTRIPG
jgi:hypothetical protein